jgi:hypothetical protein
MPETAELGNGLAIFLCRLHVKRLASAIQT